MGTFLPRSWLCSLESGLHCQGKAGHWWCRQQTQINSGSWLVLIPCTQVVLVVKNTPANGRDVRDVGTVPGWGRSPGEGHGHPLQYSCLEKPTERGAWQATVRGVTKIQTMKWLSMYVGVFIPEKSAIAKRQGYFQRAAFPEYYCIFWTSLLFELKFEKRNWLSSALKRPSPEIFSPNKYQIVRWKDLRTWSFGDWTVKVFTSSEDESKIPEHKIP